MTILSLVVVLSTLIVCCSCQDIHNNNDNNQNYEMLGKKNKVETVLVEPTPDLIQQQLQHHQDNQHHQHQKQNQDVDDVSSTSTSTSTTITGTTTVTSTANDDDYDYNNNEESFDVSPLAPNEIQHVKWSDNYEVVSPNTYRIGLSPRIRQGLLEYANRAGVIEFMEQKTFGGMSERPDTQRSVDLPYNKRHKDGHKTSTSPDEDNNKDKGRDRNDDVDEEDGINNNNNDTNYLRWYVNRPSPKWKSDMHWLSPGGPETQSTFLQALGDAGFDDVLDSIGRKLFSGVVADDDTPAPPTTRTTTTITAAATTTTTSSQTSNGLVAYQLTFIGVSECSQGFMHDDFTNTHPEPNMTRAFNIIIPLIIPEEEENDESGASSAAGANGNGSQQPPRGPTMPAGLELASRQYAEDGTMFNEVGFLKYRYDEAVMLGDDSGHATSPVYHKNAMRLAATIYIADVNEGNYKNFPCNQPYPPVQTNPRLLLDIAGRDWHPTDPTRRLPKRSDMERK